MAVAQVNTTDNNFSLASPVSLLLAEEMQADTTDISRLLSGEIPENESAFDNIKQLPETTNNTIEINNPNTDNDINIPLECAKQAGALLFGALVGAIVFIKAPGICKYLRKMPIPTFIRKNFIKKQVKLNNLQMANFRPIKFIPSRSLNEVKKFGKTLGIKKIIAEENDAPMINDILEVMTSLKNQSKGRIVLPQKIVISNIIDKYGAVGGANRCSTLTILRNHFGDGVFKATILHELGHLNHFNNLHLIRDFELMGKKFKDFGINENELNIISKYLNDYATTDPYEFVAECYAALLSGRKLPAEIMQLYAKCKGPMSWKYIKQPIQTHTTFNMDLNNLINGIFNANNFEVISLKDFAK